MSFSLDHVSAYPGLVSSRGGRRRPNTPAFLLRASLRLDRVEAEIHVLDHPGRRPAPEAVAAFLAGDREEIGLAAYAGGDAAPELSSGVRLRRPCIPVGKACPHGMTIEFLAAYRHAAGNDGQGAFGKPPGFVADATTDDRRPEAKATLAERSRRFGLALAGIWLGEVVPEDLWRELAGKVGARYSPAYRPVVTGEATAVYIRDAAPSRWDRPNPPRISRPHLMRAHRAWLDRKGREYVLRSCERAVAALRLAAGPVDMAEHLAQLAAI